MQQMSNELDYLNKNLKFNILYCLFLFDPSLEITFKYKRNKIIDDTSEYLP